MKRLNAKLSSLSDQRKNMFKHLTKSKGIILKLIEKVGYVNRVIAKDLGPARGGGR